MVCALRKGDTKGSLAWRGSADQLFLSAASDSA